VDYILVLTVVIPLLLRHPRKDWLCTRNWQRRFVPRCWTGTLWCSVHCSQCGDKTEFGNISHRQGLW